MRTALLYNFLIEANIMASIAILLMMLLRKFLRRPLGNGALCFGWLLVAMRLLLPLSLPNPLINGIRSPFAMDIAIRPIAGQVKVRLHDFLIDFSVRQWGLNNKALGDRAFAVLESIESAQLTVRLANLYVLGVVAVAVWFALSNARFRRRLRVGRIEPISGRLLEQYQAVCAQRGVKPVPVYFTDPLPSACLVGVFRPYIALPLTASPQEAVSVLTHEVCHLKNRDHLWGVLRLACCALHWFNPLVWIAAAMSRTDGELRCDDRVTAPMGPEQRQAYANVLVLAAARRNAPGLGVLATGMTMTGRRLKTRVVTILRDSKPVRWFSVAFILLSTMCLAGAFATGEVRVVPRLFRSHPAISRTTITTEQEAVDYAKTVFSLPDLGGMDVENMNWHVENAADDPDECYIYAGETDDLPICDMVCDRAGNIKAISVPLPGSDSMYASTITLNREEQQNLADDLRRFIAQVNPALAQRCGVYQFVQEYWMDTERCVEVAFWPNETSRENNDDVSVYITVQSSPKTRIVNFSVNYGSANGNG